jgi:threonine/homoserine/homoserine lactone efflux protein
VSPTGAIELLSGDDWALTALAALGLVYLCWQAALTLKARVLPVLEADERDGGGA